jgi:hypothetical protein
LYITSLFYETKEFIAKSLLVKMRDSKRTKVKINYNAKRGIESLLDYMVIGCYLIDFRKD